MPSPRSTLLAPDRNRERLHRIAARLPVLSRYERRIADLIVQRAALREEVSALAGAGGPEFVPAGHFYSAIPDLPSVRTRHQRLMQKGPADIPGVDLHLDRQWDLARELHRLLPDMPFSDEPAPGLRYGLRNGAYSYGDGTMLHLMLRWLRPARVIEVGSGHSSACTLDTIDQFLGGACHATFIEPYDELLRSLLSDEDQHRVTILTQEVQDVPIEVFQRLGDRDLLFIDSTHVSKVGSDVNYLIFEVLPALRPGVVVHFHDVFPRFEYPWSWLQEGRVWQEDYLLRAFLQYNSDFEVIFWPAALAQLDAVSMGAMFPTMTRNPGGSIYLRRSGGSALGPGQDGESAVRSAPAAAAGPEQ